MAGKSPATFAKQCNQFGSAFHVAARAGTVEAATLVTSSVAAQLGGRSITLRGVGKKGGKVSVGYDILGTGSDTSARVKMKGPAQLIERDTKAHPIRAGARRGKRPKALLLADGSFRAGVMHPGTKGKHPFAKGVETARPLVPEVYARASHRALASTFTGGKL